MIPALRFHLRLAALTAACALALTALPAAPASAGPAPAPSPVNVALTGTATASSVENGTSFVAANVNDGNIATRWSSTYNNNEWLQLQLATAGPVAYAEIVWPNACARDYALQTSLDGITWSDAIRRAGTTCGRTDSVDLGGVTAKFVRMQGISRWSTYGYSISEFRIFNGYAPAESAGINLVPQPVQLTPLAEDFRLSEKTKIVARGEAALASDYLGAALRTSTGYPLLVVPSASSSHKDAVTIDVASGLAPEGHDAEGYTLRVDAAGVTVHAATAEGALNGVKTLMQLFPATASSATFHPEPADGWLARGAEIQDYPRFEYRGSMLDVARNFYTVADVQRHIDSVSQFKINVLHLHLTDDQGWRIAMDAPASSPSGIDYSQLTGISGGTAMTYNRSGALMGTRLADAGFYTKSDFQAIVSYAASKGMSVVPEIDVPSHINAALHAVPQLNSANSKPSLAAGQATVPANGTPDVGYSSLDAANPATFEFLKEVLTQLAAMTPGKYVHIGGDEAHVTSHADYLTMVNAASADVAATGKTVIGWNEYAGSELPANSVVQYWNGNKAAVANAVTQKGAKLILSPADRTYAPQRADSRQPQGGTWACGGVCGMPNWYNWDPATYIPGIAESSVLGVETAVWGEFLRGIDQVQFFQFPRLLATAEAGWTPQSSRTFADFTARTAALGHQMAARGINFIPSQDVTWTQALASANAEDSAPGGANASWTVSAPGASTGSFAAVVRWSDGIETAATVTQSQAVDFAGMKLGSPLVIQAQRTGMAPGSYQATLILKRDLRNPTEYPLSLTVK